MATIMVQRDLVIALKQETTSNVAILGKLQPMPAELLRLVCKDNAFEKPTQNLFNHLSFYLLSIIDENVCASFTWPLYDTKAERAYRNELASFISDYSSKGLLSPVMSSYLVNPACFKVTVLMFQLSQLAVKRMLLIKMVNDSKKQLYSDMTERYASQKRDGFIECIDGETKVMLNKFSNYLYKRKTLEHIAEILRKKITDMETKLASTNAQNYINNIVNGFMIMHDVDEEMKLELCKIKNVSEQPNIFDAWLKYFDMSIDRLQDTWDRRVSPLLGSCQKLYECTEALITRHTGECDPSMYTVEYNHKTDEIHTRDLEDGVNSEQKYVLRNLVRNEQLNFPNLIRAFVISICFILKHNEMGDEIYMFNEYLDAHRRSYAEMVSAMRALIDRIFRAEAKLGPTTVSNNWLHAMKDLPEIPPLPDLSNLKATRDSAQILFDTYTPLSLSKYQFNLGKKNNVSLFAKPQTKSLITPFHPAPRDDFLKSIISCRISSYDNQAPDIHNRSEMFQNNKVNETIAECSSGFTKQQLSRLLSTNKSSSSKKFRYITQKPNINIKKGGLFHESGTSNDSNGLFRSYSSPNLFENREKRYHTKLRGMNLSIMQEDSPVSILDMSGVMVLDRNINNSTPQDIGTAESSRKMIDTSIASMINVTSDKETRMNNIQNVVMDFNKEMGNSVVSPILDDPRKSVDPGDVSEVKNETPKVNTRVVRKTSSLEKIINRFKKVRASVMPPKEDSTDIKMIAEEENMKSVNFGMFTANRLLLPDLLSPSCNNVSVKSNNHVDEFDQICLDTAEGECRKQRQSLGTALGVDETFLDQFDLID